MRHDAVRPFRVYTKDAVIQDIGTEFNVYNRADGTVVAVLKGSVTVAPAPPAELILPRPVSIRAALPGAAAKSAKILTANEEARVDHDGTVDVRTLTNAADSVAWKQRRLVFRQQTLRAIVEEFNRYSRKKIRLEDPAAADHLYTGVFDGDDPDSLVQVLEREADLAIDTSADAFVIKAR